jgi:hypothetical protein
MTTPQHLYQRMRTDHSYRWYPTPQEAAWLEPLSQTDLNQLVQALCAEPVGDNQNVQGEAFRATYQWRMYACILSILRPDPQLYHDLLQAVLRIDDPSSNAVGIVALQQVQSRARITQDLLHCFRTYQDDTIRAFNISALFYWLRRIPPGRIDVYGLTEVLSMDYLHRLWLPRVLPPTDAVQWTYVHPTIEQLLQTIDCSSPHGHRVQQYVIQIMRDEM